MKRRWDWNAICDVCGFKYRGYELKKRYDGLMVCKYDWETRHPQEFIRIPADPQNIPWSRPEQADVFIVPSYVASTVGIQGGDVPVGTFPGNGFYVDFGYFTPEDYT